MTGWKIYISQGVQFLVETMASHGWPLSHGLLGPNLFLLSRFGENMTIIQ